LHATARAALAYDSASKRGPVVTIRGRVLDVGGKPLTGAKLLLFGTAGKPVELGSSGAQGLFTVEVPKDGKEHFLVARADNAGLDFIDLEELDSDRSVELHMVKDKAIHGRVIDTQGGPVAGVRVTLGRLNIYKDNSLERFL